VPPDMLCRPAGFKARQSRPATVITRLQTVKL